MGTSKLLWGQPDKMLGVTCDGLLSHPGGVEILLVASYHGNRREAPALISLRARPVTIGADVTYLTFTLLVKYVLEHMRYILHYFVFSVSRVKKKSLFLEFQQQFQLTTYFNKNGFKNCEN